MKSDWATRLKRRLLLSLAIFLVLVAAGTTAVISMTVGNAAAADSKAITTELGAVVRASVAELMVTGDPERIGHVINSLAKNRDAIAASFVLDHSGTIRYSTQPGDVGRTVNRMTDPTCVVCHSSDAAPSTTTQRFQQGGQNYVRNVTVLFNEPTCQTCHGTEHRIVGKVVVDRPMAATEGLLASIRRVVIGAGLFSLLALAVSVPAVGRGIDRYIQEITHQGSEITVLYTMVKHLSKTIEPRALRAMTLRTALATFHADEVVMVLADDLADREGHRLRRGDHAESRADIDTDEQIREAVDRWTAGSLSGVTPMAAGDLVAVPLSRSGVRLGLILIRRSGQTMDAQTRRLLLALARHASVALQNARLHALAVSDDLTKLYTSRHFRTCLDAALDRYERQQEPFGLIFLDADNFKRINDTFGHVVGDDVLRRIAGALIGSLRPRDLAFRYGGEELTALLPGADAAEAIAIADAIRRSVEQLRPAGWPEGLSVTVSAGVAACPDDGATARNLIVRADEALYVAKRTGKNRVVGADRMSTAE